MADEKRRIFHNAAELVALAKTDWDAFILEVFFRADLPEVDETKLKPDLLTNKQIAELFRANPLGLISFLENLQGGNNTWRRAVLSEINEYINNE